MMRDGRAGLAKGLAALMVLMVALAGCSGAGSKDSAGSTTVETSSSTGEKSEAVRKTDLVVALEADLTMVDPNMHVNTPERNVLSHVYDFLVRLDADMQIRPALAERWEDAGDDVTWTFHLRKGVTYHDGSTFGAADVKYTLDRILNSDNASPQKFRISAINQVNVIDEHTVQLVTAAPFPTLLYELAQVEIVPEGAAAAGAKIEKPVGTGPFKFVEWRRDDRLILEVNKEYWGQVPSYERIVFRFIPEVATRVAELRSGGVDLIKGISPEELTTLEKDSNFTVISRPTTRLMYLGFRVDDQGIPKEVRHAIAQALDKKALVDHILLNRADVANSVVAPQAFGAHASMKPLAYDVERAKQLIEAAGYKGKTIRFDATSGKYPGDADAARAIAEMLQQVGLNIDLQVLEYGSYLKSVNEDPQMYQFAWGQATPDADAATYRNFHSQNKPRMRYNNPAVDAALDKGRSTLDEKVRMEAYAELQELLKEDAVWIPLYFLHFGVAHSKDLSGFFLVNEDIRLEQISFK